MSPNNRYFFASSDDSMLDPATQQDSPSSIGRPHEASREPSIGLASQKQRRLAELSVKLDCQAATCGSRGAPRHIDVGDAYPEDLAGAVLGSSFSSLDLLSTFQVPPPSHDHSSIANACLSSAHHCPPSPPSSSISSGNSAESLSSPKNPFSGPVFVHSHRKPAKAQPVNLTTSLQLLACYTHLLHLHSLLYTATHAHLIAQSRCASTSTLPILGSAAPRPLFPALQVHGVPLTRPSIYKF